MPRQLPIAFRVTEGEHAVIQAAASAAGLSYRQFLVGCSVEYAKACLEMAKEGSEDQKRWARILDEWTAEKFAVREVH